MALSNNPAVRMAYAAGTYTDKNGREWRRGMDGWFLDNWDSKGGVLLTYHHLMVEMIEKENPE
ncbi:MAG TPA: hypothetical protein VJ617_21060 [Arthrobacter sp.]|nr:hypothetical protein [Arthrobacter sp.]